AGVSYGGSGDARGDAQHLFVQQIGLGILAKKAAPGATAKEGKHFGAGAELVQYGVVTLADTRREHPLHHLGVGSGGEIGATQGRMRSEVLSWRAHFDASGIVFEGG